MDHKALTTELDANGVPAELRDRYIAAFIAMDLHELIAATTEIVMLAAMPPSSSRLTLYSEPPPSNLLL